ncbi:Ff.00g054580.m01.CDS01 [Fusarium sp. VM40]|nr:Ff.00g054580.m01.CDS01 [Fusarium sp. VM40]
MSTNQIDDSLRFDGQTILVTGTTNGLGRSTSFELVKRGVETLIMGVRNVSQGEALKRELLALAPQVTVHVVELQLDDFVSVVAFSNHVASLTSGLDVAVLNAGVGGYDFKLSKSGHENIIQVNVYSNTLLALELLRLLEQTAKEKSRPSRLTWVGSFVQMDHGLTKKSLAPDVSIMSQLDSVDRFDKSRYQDSKLMTTLIVERLAQHVNKDLVILNEVSPGPALTNFGATYPAYFRIALSIAGHFINKDKQIANGVKNYLHAMAVVGQESHGQYISDYKLTPRAPFTMSADGHSVGDSLFTELIAECYKADESLKHI